jgi:hypothetical protein
MAYSRRKRDRRGSGDGSARETNDMERELRDLRQENGKIKAKLAIAQRQHRDATLPTDKPAAPASKSGVGGAAGLGVAASGTKEVLDWLWEIMRPQFPYLYDFLHLDAVDAGIMAMITGVFVWLGGRKLK